jgi:hypothetical protein
MMLIGVDVHEEVQANVSDTWTSAAATALSVGAVPAAGSGRATAGRRAGHPGSSPAALKPCIEIFPLGGGTSNAPCRSYRRHIENRIPAGNIALA